MLNVEESYTYGFLRTSVLFAKHSLYVLIALVIVNPTCLAATDITETPVARPQQSWDELLNERIMDNWTPSGFPLKDEVRIIATAADDGRLYNVTIDKSSSNAQMDCDCLTAVLGASGFAPKPTVHLVLSRRMFTFNLETACGHKSTAFRDFLLQHPEYKDGYIAFYRIPLDTLRRYPGLFEKRELLAPSNVALVKNDDESKYHIGSSALDYIMIQYSLWSQFFANNKTPTKTAVLQMASQIVTVRQ